MLIDTHVHMHHFNSKELDEIISHPNCPNIIVNSVHTKEQLKYGQSLQAGNDAGIVFLTSAGVHPQIADISDSICINFLDILEENIKSICAIGEVGYDLYEKNPPLSSQKYIFLKEMELAVKYDLPLIIHCRNAFDILLEDLKNVEIPVVFHGYSGGFKYLDEIIKRGYYISLGTPITYEQSRVLRRIAKMVPINQMLIETDSPFNLSRHSDFEKEKNKPYYLKNIIELISEIKEIPLNSLESSLLQNFSQIVKMKY